MKYKDQIQIPAFYHVPKNAGTYYISMMLLFFRKFRRMHKQKWIEAQDERSGKKTSVESIKNIEIYDDQDDTMILARVLIADPLHSTLDTSLFSSGSKFETGYLRTTLSNCSKIKWSNFFLFSVVIEADGFVIDDKILKIFSESFSNEKKTQIKYLKHLILRNPYARARSFFNYITSDKSKHERTHGKIVYSTFKEYLQSLHIEDSWIIRVMCNMPDTEGIEEFHYEFVKDLLSEFKVYDISNTDDLLNDVFESCYGISMTDIPEEWSINIVKNTSSHKTAEKVEVSDLNEDVRAAFFERTHHDYLVYESCLNK
jgi:hypothetical protein